MMVHDRLLLIREEADAWAYQSTPNGIRTLLPTTQQPHRFVNYTSC
jgi:hypothetical protein